MAQEQDIPSDRASIRRVRSWFEGGMIRRTEALQLRGGVLVYHCQSATDVGSVYFPARAFAVEYGRRFDGRILIRALLIPLAYLIVGGLLMVTATQLAHMNEVQDYSATVFWGGLLAALACAIVGTMLFLIPLPTTRFVADTDEWSVILEFWHRRGKNPPLDALVANLRRHPRPFRRAFPFPVTLSHDWTVAYPVRATVLYVIGLYCSLWIAITLAQYTSKLFGWNWSLPPGATWILIVPLLLGLIYLVRNQVTLGRRAREYRASMDAFLREDYREAEDTLETMLALRPLDMEALLLLVHVHLRREAFDNALQCCTLIGNLDPELGDEMAEQIWVIRRMHELERPAE
jgi:hypothetical protein